MTIVDRLVSVEVTYRRSGEYVQSTLDRVSDAPAILTAEPVLEFRMYKQLAKTITRYARVGFLYIDEFGCAPRGAEKLCKHPSSKR